MAETTVIDRLFLELSQFSTAKTRRETELEQELFALCEQVEQMKKAALAEIESKEG